MGHVYRGLNLAKILGNNKHKVVFLTQEKPSKVILSKKFDCIFSENHNLLKKKNFLKKYEPDIIIVDKLRETSKNLRFLKKYCKIILSIDYIGKNKELIDYAINILYPVSGKKKGAFSSLKYAVIDEKFNRKQFLKIRKDVGAVLILQGGADTYCFTPRIINALNGIKNEFKITAIVGPFFKCWEKLKKARENCKKPLKILQNVKNINEIMIQHDIAITAGGNTLLELASLGVPSVVICGEKFEEETSKILQRNGFGINLGFGKDLSGKKIENIVNSLMNNKEMRIRMSKNGKNLIDGKGSNRIANIIQSIYAKT